MPSATLDDIALRSTNPVKRAIDVFCVVMLQLLMMIMAADEQNAERRCSRPALSACTILARLDAGETFDLPPLVIASLRSFANTMRANMRRGGSDAEPSTPPIPTEPKKSASSAKAKCRSHFAPDLGQALLRAGRAIIGGLTKESAYSVQGIATPI